MGKYDIGKRERVLFWIMVAVTVIFIIIWLASQ